MSQTDELSRVKARIKALTEKTVANGCTEAEAMSAAEMVGRLLERYALSMDEIEVRTAKCVQVEVDLGSRRRRPIDRCVPAIARFCDCKVWLSPAARLDPDDPYKILLEKTVTPMPPPCTASWGSWTATPAAGPAKRW